MVSPGLITEEPHYTGAPAKAVRYPADRNDFVDPFITERKAVINNRIIIIVKIIIIIVVSRDSYIEPVIRRPTRSQHSKKLKEFSCKTECFKNSFFPHSVRE